MSNRIRWLLGQIELWVAEGLIRPEQGEALRRRYAADTAKGGAPWGIILFAGFGAVVLGLGIILLFAYNWAEMHKFTKLGIVFGALAAAHAGGLLLRRRENLRGFAEALQLLGTMLFGAGIWLVAQIYHISAHFPNAFLAWAAGALLLAWALPSVAQGLVAAVLLAVWACTEAVAFQTPMLAAPLLILAGTGLLAWQRRSPVLLTATIASFTVSVAACAMHGFTVYPLLLATALLLAALGVLLKDHPRFPAAGVIFQVTGRILYFPLLFLMTFHDALEHELLPGRYASEWLGTFQEWLPLAVLTAAALFAAVLAMLRTLTEPRDGGSLPETVSRLLVPAGIFLAYILTWWAGVFRLLPMEEDTAAVMMALAGNAVFLYHTVRCLWHGCREAGLGLTVGGSILLGAWVFARFSDLFESLLARGVMFVAVGVALFVIALLYHRARKRKPDPAAAARAAGKEG